eukprot:TRINITY_DN17527_c0_g4_i1.p1 TRINITY_DN17527_c0_g4~~TRINITY_DN17527_c0_g4_i1.p1  ORF type:complete len:465 (-),score=112.00 TRINITY_DN17527_c0_g4_i1:132-1526(-)
MSKKGTYNAAFFNGFTARLHGTPIRYGTLIGTPSNDGLRDIVYAAPTPPQPSSDDNDAPVAPVKDVLAHLQSKAGPSFATWASQHAVALRKLLPVGVEPCGCFVVISESAARDLASVLGPLLKGIQEAFVLTIDPMSKKLSFWQYVGGAKAALRPAQMKADSHKDCLSVWAAVPVDVAVPRGWDSTSAIAASRHDDDVAAAAAAATAAAEAAVKAVEVGVDAALARCTCGVTVETTDDSGSGDSLPMRLVDAKSEGTVAAMAGKGCAELRVAFLRNGTCLTVSESSPKNAGGCLRLRSLVVATALVLRRDVEMRQVVDMLRKSLAASVAERLQLAQEEAAEVGGGGDRLQLPWRSLYRPTDLDLPLWCGDYCMPDEEAKSGQERLGQLLCVAESCLEEAPRKLDENAVIDREYKSTYDANLADQIDDDDGDSKAVEKVNASQLACAAAVIVAIAALLVPLSFRT